MGNAIQTFNYNGKNVRTVEMDGEPWFVLKDVCQILGITDHKVAARRLEEDEVCLIPLTDSMGRKQQMTIINESGLYNIVLRSDKNEAKPFRKWVTSEVLPSIRKHGAYVTPSKLNELLCRPESVIQMLTALSEEQKKNAELTAKNAELKPKADFADAVIATNDAIPIGTFAKVLNQNGVDIGQNRFFSYLRENEYLISRSGETWNMPTQKSMDLGLFKVDTMIVSTVYGTNKLKHQVRITPKGQEYFVRKFLHNEECQSVIQNAV